MDLKTLINHRAGAFEFYGKWKDAVGRLGETGMGYVIVSITLSDGTIYPQAVIAGEFLLRVRGLPNIPFSEDDITAIKQTDEKWNFSEIP
jgi:hypothetical protein